MMENLGAELLAVTKHAIAERRKELRERALTQKAEAEKLSKIPKTIRHLVPDILRQLQDCAKSRGRTLVVQPLLASDFKTERGIKGVPKDAPLTGTAECLRRYFQNQKVTCRIKRIKPRHFSYPRATIYGLLILKW